LGRREVIEPRRHQRRRWHIVLKRVMRVRIPPSQSTGALVGCALPLSFLEGSEREGVPGESSGWGRGRKRPRNPSALKRGGAFFLLLFLEESAPLKRWPTQGASPCVFGEASRTTTIALTVSWLLCVHILGFRAQTTTSELTKPAPFLSVRAVQFFRR